MRWDRWKLGAGVSVALSVFVALAGLTAGMGWRAFLAVLGAALATHFGAFIKDHPTDSIQFDDDKTQSDKSNEK
jgi:O-antigen ligase